MKEKAVVALAYDQIGAIKIVASGQGEVARCLIEAAQELGVPIQKDAQLVEALIKIEIDQEIPPELYTAVAEILTLIYRLDSEWSVYYDSTEPATIPVNIIETLKNE
ncbi:flagellar biosynthesis protein FlhB [Desulfosporosinus fructosivorans]|uniref:Flagellar biosynthesis protein FlhB n=1 Tax=Desulfosporosinus fructosivorans TaxID=2018669 RepID=A0A4Z0R248_9FIRM|nr:EscU/YscU/HrcU family type III secretion system export apparatus switch protein [Desulfosporosinus fructosivorans]TGE37121.1 flagellar biosynthesis protein FlhB [Desulfosporosinus fructosivorans]